MKVSPIMADLEPFGITMKDLRFLKDTEEMRETVPPMMVVEVTEDFNMNLDNTVYELKAGQVLVIQFNLMLTIQSFLDRDGKTNVFKKHDINFRDMYRPYCGQDLSGKKLFIMATSIGDTLFVQPVIRKIKKLYPDCKITYAASPTIKEMISCYPKGLVDRVYESTLFVDKTLVEEADYHLYCNFLVTKNFEAHKLDAYEMFSKFAGFDFHDDIDTDYAILEPKKFAIDEVKRSLPINPYVVCQIRSSTSNRMIPSEKWLKIISALIDNGRDIVFVDTGNFYDVYENDIKSKFPLDKQNRIKNLCRVSRDMRHVVAIISQAEGVIGVDSSFVHIAAALKVPVIGIYTAFLGKVRASTFKGKHNWVDAEGVECRRWPCFFHQDELMQGFCEYVRMADFPDCVKRINPDEVVKKYLEMFK